MNEMNEIGDRLLVIFDGNCGFCNRSVRWFLHRDRKDRLRFVASQSPKVRGVLARHGLGISGPESGPDTIIVVRDSDGTGERVYLRSDAAREMLAELPQPWPTAGIVLGRIPRPVRDACYRVIARWRHQIGGRLESCPIPTVEERGRFL